MLDKALYQAPAGLAAIDEEPIEIEIEDPEAVDIHVGDVDIEISKEEEDFSKNLAKEMDESVLKTLASELISDVDMDISSRKDWIQTYVDGLELLGLKIEERTEPWEGACGVYHPLLSEALVKFQAETVMETLPPAGPVKTQIIGRETPEKIDASERVQQDMNFQIMQNMPEYRPEHERMLWGLGLSGNAFKKVYFDPSLDRQVSMYVPAEDIIVPYGASSLETAERVTHVMRKTENEIRKLMVAGFYIDMDLGTPTKSFDEVEKKIAEKMGFSALEDDRFKILEIHVNLDLEGYEDEDKDGNLTGIALPYVVTIEKSTCNVLAIRRNWKPNDKNKLKRQHFVHYGYVPGFGFYCFGLIHLVGSFAKSGTSLIRQLVDAGTLSNLPGGFKTRGLRVKGDDTPIGPGEWRDVDVPSGVLKDNLMALPYKEPSMVLAGLLDKIVDEGRRFASAADLQIADMSAQTPVGTTLAVLERVLKVMSAVQARIHYSMKQELQLLRDIIKENTPPEYSYQPEEGNRFAKKADYEDIDVIPVSDPNAATMSQKIVQYQAVIQLAQQAPQLYNLPYLHRQMIQILGIKNAEKLVPLPDDKKPADPITENMNLMNMKPVKAFMYQNHEAHIQVHMNAMQDPKLAQLLAQNPQAQAIQSAALAHINEHLAFEYRRQMEDLLGVQLPDYQEDDEESIPKNLEVQISAMAAQASNVLLNRNKTEIAAQQAQQAAQDPIIQMQQRDLAIKEAEVQRKAKKDADEFTLKQKQQQIELQRIASQEKMANKAQGVNLAEKVMQLKTDQENKKTGMGVDLIKHATNMHHDRKKTNKQILANVMKPSKETK